ncbi:MAG TPA: hypothetical protein VHZ50_12745 [Puia sp.]|jgi:hypothetical protein|nr:hypothetical protein [Puia sp.]
MKKSFALLIVCVSAILSSSFVIILIYKTGFLLSMMIVFFLLTCVVLFSKYNSYKRLKQMALSKKDIEITNQINPKKVFVNKRSNADAHDFQARTATENRV